MKEIGNNQYENYKKQGLGGYDDDEESLDNSGKIELWNAAILH